MGRQYLGPLKGHHALPYIKFRPTFMQVSMQQRINVRGSIFGLPSVRMELDRIIATMVTTGGTSPS
jgi:hypothetical protein